MWWQDVIFFIVVVAFFALMVLFVRMCERIVGSDDGDAVDGGLEPAEQPVEVAA
jgi:hypothetical protein